MISPQNEQEFKSLGIETVRRRAAASVWDEAKSREAREWISNEETRIGHSIASPRVILGRIHAHKRITRLGVYDDGELAG